MGASQRLGIIALMVVITCNCISLSGISVKSTAPGGIPTTSYQGGSLSLVSGDVVRGHVELKKGFSVGVGAVTWDATGVVEGPITFTDATSILVLKSDLRLGGTGSITPLADTSLTSGGWGQTYGIDGGGRTIFMGGDFTIGNDVQRDLFLNSNLTIDGQGHTLTLQNSSNFRVRSGFTLTLKNMTIVCDATNSKWGHFNGGNGTNSNFIFDNVTIIARPNGSNFAGGVEPGTGGTSAVTFRNKVSILGAGARFSLRENFGTTNFTIDKNSTLYFGPNVIVQLSDANSFNCTLSMVDHTSVLHIDGAKFYMGPNGLQLTKGTLLVDNKTRIFNCEVGSEAAPNTDMTKGLILGDGSSSANDVDVRVLGGAYVVVDGCVDYKHSSGVGVAMPA